ncbi:MAG: Clp protease N-terminal domain-containing protein [Terracidiphilus sp.]|jgi:ATP-dependent Clp protease ATP-binding subunit ClpC
MFERYTEKSRRVIFFARYEASQFGSPFIETEHLLLGLLREDKALTNRFLRSHASFEAIRKQIEAHTTIREKVSTSVDLPLSSECKRVLAYAAEEAERLGHKHIGTEHLLLGLLREEKCFAWQILKDIGVKLATVRDELARVPHTTDAGKTAVESSPESAPLSEFSRDLTQTAIDGELDPVVGRDQEIDGLIEVLSSRDHKNPVLIGERGAGKTAIVEALAQRIADSKAPSFLAEKRILILDPQSIAGSAKGQPQIDEGTTPVAKLLADRRKAGERVSLAKALANASGIILFIDDLRVFLPPTRLSGTPIAAEILRPVLARNVIQCIGASAPGEYAALIQAAPWIENCFRAVHVRPMDEESALCVLQACKQRYEKFHGVTYADDALECAARGTGRYLPECSLPDKALELLDAAGARVKLRETSMPEEVAEVQKRIKFIVHRMDSAISNHEFEKAKFYSDEERKERENLRILREKYHLDDSSLSTVSREDVEETIKRWAAYPFQP